MAGGLPRIAAAVHLVDEQSNPCRFLARADALVHPFFTQEFPNVLGESRALRVPVIAADSAPGIREHLEDGRSGVLVPPGDPAALAGAIESKFPAPEDRTELAESGSRHVEVFALAWAHTVRSVEGTLS